MQDTLNNALESNFTRIPNSVIVDPVFNGRRDGAFRAWVLMASKPQGFQFYTEVLARELDISRQAMADRMDYLVEHDYLIKQPYRSSGGQRANAWTVVIPEIAMSIRTNMAQTNMVQTNMARLDTNKKDPKQEVLINKIDKLANSERRTDKTDDNYSNSAVTAAAMVINRSITDNDLDFAFGPIQRQELIEYVTEDGMDADVVADAIKLTKDGNQPSFKYTDGILKNRLAKHLLTMSAVIDNEKKRNYASDKYGDKQKKEIW
ncbi:DnaD domain protein [Weissella cibaria]|uniref:DnaD domain protein n=1 Tax=Weissella cibaria TaxID=137591 RepID=UPI0022E0F385|nr:DnaD domain protein [Weissella cibaria]